MTELAVLHCAFHAWCLSACVSARVGCQSSGPGSPGISPPSDGIRDIPGTRIYSPAAEAWHCLFRLLFLVSMRRPAAFVQLTWLPTQLCLFPRNSLTEFLSIVSFLALRCTLIWSLFLRWGKKWPTEDDWRNWHGLIKGTGHSLSTRIQADWVKFWSLQYVSGGKTDLQHCPKQRACWVVWNHFIFLSFTFLKQVPVYLSCSGDRCTALLSWISRNVT